MNDYYVKRINGDTAVLIKGGLSINVPLVSLPDGVCEGEVLLLNEKGLYVRPEDKAEKQNNENSSLRDELFQGETYDIKQGVNRSTLYAEVCSTLYRSTVGELKHMIPELVLLGVSICAILPIVFVDLERFRLAIVHGDISIYIGTLCSVVLACVGVIGLILSCVSLFRTFRKLKIHLINYKSNLRRMQDKLENNGIFTGITPEEEGRFDNVFTQISESVKNREKNT